LSLTTIINSNGLQQVSQSSINRWFIIEGSIIFSWFCQQWGQSK